MQRRLLVLAAIAMAAACGLGSGSGSDGGGGGGGGGNPGGNSDGGGTPDLAVGPVATADLAMTRGADLAPSRPAFVYVSGYSTTIGRYTLDLASGALTPTGTTAATGSPSFLAVDPARRHLYAVDEANSKVEAFAIDAATGALSHLGNDASSGGSGPAHLGVDGSGHWVLVANYGSGHVAVLPIGADGSVTAGTSLLAGKNAHQVLVDGSNHFAWVPCLGSNYVAQYTFDAQTGTLTPQTPATVMTPGGSGPRHLALHPTRALAYLIEETSSTIAAYTVDAGGKLTLLQAPQSTRANGATGNNTGAEVQVHPSGNFVYVSNRGDDDIGVFSVGSDGKLTPIAHTKTGGQTPRHFSIEPGGRFLLVANQGSGDVRVFAIASSGLLSGVGAPVTATMPSFVGVVPAP